MMPGYGGMGWGWLFMSFGTVFFFALVGLAIWLLIRASAGSQSTGSPTTGSAREILAERYARGDIDEQEYHKRLRTLDG